VTSRGPRTSFRLPSRPTHSSYHMGEVVALVMSTSTHTTDRSARGPRLANDPDKYIRVVKGGKYQARPYDEGVRYNLGLYATKHQARKAIQEFWWGRFAARPRWARPVTSRSGQTRWIAVVRVPAPRDRNRGLPPGWRLETIRLPGDYDTAAEAHLAAVNWLNKHVGPLVACTWAA